MTQRPIKYRQPIFQSDRSFGGFHYWGFLDDGWQEPRLGDGYGDSEQYTGLKDKHGKEIFEGDILKTQNKRIIEATIIEAHYLMHEGLETFYELSKVIGNIHENQELLEKGEKTAP